MSNAQSLVPLILEQRFGSAWLDRWRGVTDPTVQWLALGLAVAISTGRYPSPEEALGALVASDRARFPVASVPEQELVVVLGAIRTAGLWPGEARGGPDPPRRDSG